MLQVCIINNKANKYGKICMSYTQSPGTVTGQWQTVLQISGIASHFAPQIQANAMQQHFRIALIAMQNNARVIALSSANLPLTFGSDRRLDYCG